MTTSLVGPHRILCPVKVSTSVHHAALIPSLQVQDKMPLGQGHSEERKRKASSPRASLLAGDSQKEGAHEAGKMCTGRLLLLNPMLYKMHNRITAKKIVQEI